jgi:LCP family protein required for cell wall assembly
MTLRLRNSLALLFFVLLVIGGTLVFWTVYQIQNPVVTLVPVASVSARLYPTRRQITPQPTWTLTATPAPATTPTQVEPTPTFSPTPLPLARPTSISVTVTYNPSATLPIPTAGPAFSIPDDAITILLLGSDQRPDWEDWHTDAVQYVVIYPSVPAAAILSIPRDLYVYIPNFWMSRINFADLYGETADFEGGGFGLFNQTLLYNLGITADYYAKVDFDGLIGLVDAMDGIDVPVHCRLQDYWPYPDESGVYYQIALEPGIHHMDGELALWYSRSRKTTSVFSRERRQQQVLEAMWRRARQLNLLDAIPALYEQTGDLFETNLGLGNLLSLAVTAAQLDPVNIERRSIGWSEVRPYTTPYGGSVYLPIWPEIEPILADVLSPPAANRATQDPILVEVWNGTEYPDWEILAADRLYRSGYIPIVNSPDRRDYAQTVIVSFDGSPKGSGLPWLQSLFGVRDENVIHEHIADPAAALRLVIGYDYVPCLRS